MSALRAHCSSQILCFLINWGQFKNYLFPCILSGMNFLNESVDLGSYRYSELPQKSFTFA